MYEYVYETVEETTTKKPYFGGGDSSNPNDLLTNRVQDDLLVPGGLLDNAINNRGDLSNSIDRSISRDGGNNENANDYIRNDRGPLPDAEVNDLIPDVTDDALRKRIFIEGRQQPVRFEEEQDLIPSSEQSNDVLIGDQSVDPEQLAVS